MRAKKAKAPHRVAIVVYEGVALFEFSIAYEIFGTQYDRDPGVPWYEVSVCGTRRSVRTDRGLRIDVPGRLEDAITADTVIVPPPRRPDDFPAAVPQMLRRAHEHGARVVSLCTGAFLLAAGGLLDGRRATTHWEECADLARLHPQVNVDPDVLYIDDGDVLTSAGSAASLDLCLQIVRTDHGAAVAAELARELVVPLHRDGGQAQYIRAPLPDPHTDELFTGTLTWLQEHLDQQVSVTELARRSAMSRRTFARRFADTTGTTPYRWLLRQRVQLAQQLLEETDETIDAIAVRTGFVTAANLRKHFARFVNTSPLAYRRTFVAPARSA